MNASTQIGVSRFILYTSDIAYIYEYVYSFVFIMSIGCVHWLL